MLIRSHASYHASYHASNLCCLPCDHNVQRRTEILSALEHTVTSPLQALNQTKAQAHSPPPNSLRLPIIALRQSSPAGLSSQDSYSPVVVASGDSVHRRVLAATQSEKEKRQTRSWNERQWAQCLARCDETQRGRGRARTSESHTRGRRRTKGETTVDARISGGENRKKRGRR